MSERKHWRRWAALSLGAIILGLGGWATSSAAPPPPPPPPGPVKPPAPIPPPPPGPVKPPAPTPPPPPKTTMAQLGRALFNDTTLSNPHGLACASCHAQEAGWAYPDSDINLQLGPVPGAVPGRFGNRRPPTIGYASFMPSGPPTFIPAFFSYAGGFFYDGRAATLTDQAAGPFQNPNEMNNTPTGVVHAVSIGASGQLFQQTFGVAITTLTVEEAFADIIEAIVAFESSDALSPFNSKYDRFVDSETKLTPQELAGLQLFTGSTTGRPGGPATKKNANCSVCHVVQSTTGVAPDLFAASTFHNTGVPKNPANPFYKQTNSKTDPLGFNPLGAAYIDFGLGDFLYPQDSLPSGNSGAGSNGKGDYLSINGMFKTPTLRNVDSRPSADFVKCYGHNGFFKSLEQIVHFYNTRNLTTVPGEVIDFTAANPYAKLKGKPLWPVPENPSGATLINPAGATAAAGGLVGNLGLTPQDEANLVAFLKTLSDGPPSPP